jgi:hypothetical protein
VRFRAASNAKKNMMDEAVYLPEMAGASTANNMVVWLIWVGYGSSRLECG